MVTARNAFVTDSWLANANSRHWGATLPNVSSMGEFANPISATVVFSVPKTEIGYHGCITVGCSQLDAGEISRPTCTFSRFGRWNGRDTLLLSCTLLIPYGHSARNGDQSHDPQR